MKKILLATTILGMSAGYAAADITWGGSAAAGIASNGTANGGDTQALVEETLTPVHGDDTFETYSSVNLAVTFSGTSDSGLTFGATFDLTAGTSYTLADDDGFVDESGAFGMPTVFVEGSFGKLAISDDNYDFYDDAHDGGDAQYTGTFGSFNVGLIANVDNNTASVKLGYTAGNLALSLNADNAVNTATNDGIVNGTNEAQANISAAYTMGSIVITGAAGTSVGAATEASLKVAYAANGISASAKFKTDDDSTTDNSVDIAVGYEANGITVAADTNTVSNKWTVTAAYDLGGGLSVEAGTNYTQDMMIGAKMAF